MPKKVGKPPANRCKERKRNGDLCKNAPMRGRDVCSVHARKAHRPTVIDADLRERFMQGLATGVGIQTAAAYAGIGRSTAHGWLDRGEQEQAAGATAETSEFVAFLDGVTRTRAQVQVRLAGRVLLAATTDADGDGHLALKMLERLAPADFGAHQVVQHEHGGSIAVDLLGGKQPVDTPLALREEIAAVIEKHAASTIDGTATEIEP